MGAVRATISPKSDVLAGKVKGISVESLPLQSSKEKSATVVPEGVNGGKTNSVVVPGRVSKLDQKGSELATSGDMDVASGALGNGQKSSDDDALIGNGDIDTAEVIDVGRSSSIETSGPDESAKILEQSESDTTGGRGILGSKPEAPPEETPESVAGIVDDAKAIDEAFKRPERRVFRGPRPDFTLEIYAIRVAEAKMKEKREKQELITAALRIKQARRTEAYEQLRNLRGTLRSCSEDLKNKYNDLEPIQASLSSLQEKGRAARSKGRELPCSTEEELDRMIAELEYRQMHETMKISEEKLLVRNIKKLKGCREDVRANVVLFSEFSDTEGQRDALQARMKAMLQVVEALKRQRDAAKKIVEEYESEAKALEAAVKDLLGDRQQAMAEHQAAYETLRNAKAELAERRRQYEAGELPASFRRKTLEEDVLALMESTGSGSSVLAPVSSNKLHSDKLEAGGAGETHASSKVHEAKASSPRPTVSGTEHGVEENTVSSPKTRIMAEKTRDSRSTFSGKEKTSKKPAPPPVIERANNASTTRLSVAVDSARVQMANGGESTTQLKEKRRLEALQKQKEAEERKRRQAERAEARAKARAEKEADEAAKRREKKEKERKAQKKFVNVKSSEGDVMADEMLVITPEPNEVATVAGSNKALLAKVSAKKDEGILAKNPGSVSKKGKKIVLKPSGKREWAKNLRRHYAIAMFVVVALIGFLLYMSQSTTI